MWSFDPKNYGPRIAELLQVSEPPPLGPGRPATTHRAKLEALRPAHLSRSGAIQDVEMANCCLAGVWLLHGFLDESHRISQNIGSPSGSYWHGIMHRREPDYSNAKYWFRRVGRHPVFDPLGQESARLRDGRSDSASSADSAPPTTQPAWDPFGFVDLCQAIAGGKTDRESYARQIALVEWQMLFDFCYRGACDAGDGGS